MERLHAAQVGASNDYEDDDNDDDEDDIAFFKSHFNRKGSLDESSGERLRKLEGKEKSVSFTSYLSRDPFLHDLIGLTALS